MTVKVVPDQITWGTHEQNQAVYFICPEFKEQVADGVVYLRGSCQRARCVKWNAAQCRMCATTKTEQQDLFEGRS
jgi:hypothetical protein